MSNRRRLQPFDPSQPPERPSIISRRKTGGSSEDWTDEVLALLRKLTRTGSRCETFLVIGFQPASREIPIPGYAGFDVAMGGNGDPGEVMFLLREWLHAEESHRASQS